MEDMEYYKLIYESEPIGKEKIVLKLYTYDLDYSNENLKIEIGFTKI